MTTTPSGGSLPPEDLTPPGPPVDPAPDGGLSVDEWIEANRHRPPAPRLPAGHDLKPRFDPDRSRKMAGWALALALLICIPFGFLVAIGLAIAVLVRSTAGGDHGKGMAVAALVISGLIIVANIAYVVVLVVNGQDETERDADGSVVDGGAVTVDRLRVGDCFSEPALDDIPDDGSTEEAPTIVDVVPCREPHQAEVFEIVELGSGDYPGDAAIQRRVEKCYVAFEDYVGIPYLRSRMDFVAFFPTSITWRLGQRTILCSLVEQDSSDVTGSQQNSRR